MYAKFKVPDYLHLTDEELKQMYARNKKRTETLLRKWKDFSEKHPEIAKQMLCVA